MVLIVDCARLEQFTLGKDSFNAATFKMKSNG